jgi:diguanylate cyclase (GGDEF)-like protein
MIGLVLLLALSMGSAMFVVIMMTRASLLKESAENARQLGGAIASSLKNDMIRRSPEEILSTINDLGRNNHLAKVFILNKNGRIEYSTDREEIGRRLDISDASCRGCHGALNEAHSSTTTILYRDGGDVHRNITLIYNEPACFGCHPKNERINGKLIIDRPLDSTYSLIARIQLIILLSAAFCLVILVPFLSRMINRYIHQIILKNSEINMVYSIIENISKTIDMDELTNIVLDIMSDALSADEVDIVLPGVDGGIRIVNRSMNGEKSLHTQLEPGDRLLPIVQRWMDGLLKRQEISIDRTEVYLPIAKGDARLSLIIVRCTHHPFPDEKLKLVEAISNHIAIAFENARLYSIAITDELTGLFTVRHFRFCMDRQMALFDRYGEKFALLMIDIDDFKVINDTYGHVAGDAVLKRVGIIIAESIRGADMGFRYGGEEFCAILPSTGMGGGRHVAERIRAQIAATEFPADGQVLRITVSLGLALCPDNCVTARDLIIEADKALYAAKHFGKNRVEASERHEDHQPDPAAPV